MATNTLATSRKPRGRKAAQPPTGLAGRLKALRQHAGISQEAVGAQGFVSAPGWIKVENGQRSPSEKMIVALVGWLVKEKAVRAGVKIALVAELTALKFSESRSPFLAKLAKEHLASLAPATL